MIEIRNVTKHFDNIIAVDHVSVTIKEGNVFGLIGTNGAGKSTVLRLTTGIYRPDEGEILIDTLPVYDNREAKKRFFFIPDEPFFFNNADAVEMERYYVRVYESFDSRKFYDALEKFGLDKKRKIHTFSKGMKKQLALLLGICAGTRYLLCDETFDGLDPVMRQGVKGLLAKTMEEREFTPVIASHNLRELEDICDHVGLLHKGGVLLSKELEEMKCNIQKVQCVLKNPGEWKAALQGVDILQEEERGTLHTFTVRGSREMVEAKFGRIETVFFEMLPLSLEEIFISETEVAGYDVKKFLMED
ncbi:MAG: ABC transporter ATP-binding protein [Lachnospiraceae bacterium]|jgi:ABC-2 type transport system ATP-binding protein|nr:ABC transporter ATP-binding protein [Lachnospiraceae bacterium]